MSISERYGFKQRSKESINNSVQLLTAATTLNRYNQDPELFWEQEQVPIATRLAERFTLLDNPVNEIIIPTHKNGIHLPTLLHGLSLQDVNDIGSTQLTFLMHNNSGNNRDSSWNIIEGLQELGAPINTVELTDSLATGPLASYQYGLLTNNAEETCFFLDADSIPIPQWLQNLKKPLDVNENALITGGQRLLLNAPLTVTVPGTVFYGLTTGQYVFQNREPNLVRSSKFYGGQAAYRAPFIKEYIHNLLGLPEGDEMLGWMIHDEFGKDSFQFANAPVVNIPDHFRNPKSLADYVDKIGKASTAILPQKLNEKVHPKKTRLDHANFKLKMTHRYCPWSRDIINAFVDSDQKESITREQVEEIFADTASSQGFEENRHVKAFLKKGISWLGSGQTLDADALYATLCNIGLECVRPTLLDHTRN